VFTARIWRAPNGISIDIPKRYQLIRVPEPT
jgi:hypothetical protein